MMNLAGKFRGKIDFVVDDVFQMDAGEVSVSQKNFCRRFAMIVFIL